ncbi:MAG: molybdopterin-dependent oxidoreductase [Proteobacteria bacterium]|nr:molybdopterin-dependent oxidoreductase [Pseudomonadota bacterium]
MTNSIPEIREAELLFVIGSNTTEAHPVIAMEMKRAVRRGAKLIVADPRAIWLSRIADYHLQLKAGTDVWLLSAMAHVIASEGFVDEEFVSTHTNGFLSFEQTLKNYSLEKAEKITGVPSSMIREAAIAYATTRKAGIYYTLGITEHTHGTDNVFALANLVLMTGHLGIRSAGLNPLRGQNNVQGANDAGASPAFYPGYQQVAEDGVRDKFETAWGAPLPLKEGLHLNAMMKKLQTGDLKGMFVMGEDIAVSEPNASSIDKALKQCEFLVCQDIFHNRTTDFADVILPAACFAEKDGTFTGSDRRVQLVRKAVDPPGLARPDWQILCDLARAAEYPMPHYQTPSEIYDEMASLSPKFAGISHKRIENEGGLQWPCPRPDHPGTPILHMGGPLIGKAAFRPVEYRPSAELQDDKYPLVLSTGRTLYQYNSAAQTRRDNGGEAKDSANFVEINPDDARRLGITNNDSVRVSSRRGQVYAVARESTRVPAGLVWMPMHFTESRANLLTNDTGDKVTGTAEYKVCAVRIEPLD